MIALMYSDTTKCLAEKRLVAPSSRMSALPVQTYRYRWVVCVRARACVYLHAFSG